MASGPMEKGFLIKRYSHAYSIEGRGQVHWNPMDDINQDPIPGYTPCGIVGLSSNDIETFPYNMRLIDSSYGIGLYHYGTGTVTVSAEYNVLFE